MSCKKRLRCCLAPARTPPTGICLSRLLPKQRTRQEAASRWGQTQQSVLGCTNLSSHCHLDRLLALPHDNSFPLLAVTATDRRAVHTCSGEALQAQASSGLAQSRLLQSRGPQLSQSLRQSLVRTPLPQQVSKPSRTGFPWEGQWACVSHLFSALQRFQLCLGHVSWRSTFL